MKNIMHTLRFWCKCAASLHFSGYRSDSRIYTLHGEHFSLGGGHSFAFFLSEVKDKYQTQKTKNDIIDEQNTLQVLWVALGHILHFQPRVHNSRLLKLKQQVGHVLNRLWKKCHTQDIETITTHRSRRSCYSLFVLPLNDFR